MSWTEATRPASRIKDCGDKRRTVDLEEKASGTAMQRKQVVGVWDTRRWRVAKGQPRSKISFWRTHASTIAINHDHRTKNKSIDPSFPLTKLMR